MNKGVVKILVSLSIAWLAFVLILDFYYAMFPRVSLGGVKILASAWAIYLLLLAVGRLPGMLVRKARGG